MGKTITSLLFAISLLILSSPVAAGSASGPVVPHSPLATVQRASAIMAARMAQPDYAGRLYVVEFSGGEYTILLRDDGVGGYDGSGVRVMWAGMQPGGWILATITAVDGVPVSCRIWDTDGRLLASSAADWATQCRVDG